RGDHAVAKVQLVQPRPALLVRHVTEEPYKALHRRLTQRAGQPPAPPQRRVKPRHVGDHVIQRPRLVVRAEAHRLTLLVQPAAEATELLPPVGAQTLFVPFVAVGELQKRHDLAYRSPHLQAGQLRQRTYASGHRPSTHPGERETVARRHFPTDHGPKPSPAGTAARRFRPEARWIPRGS